MGSEYEGLLGRLDADLAYARSLESLSLTVRCDDLEALLARVRVLEGALANSTSVLCSVRKNYEDGCGLWDDVSRFIKDGNSALTQGQSTVMAK